MAALGYERARFERCSLADALWAMASAGMTAGDMERTPGRCGHARKVWRVLAAIAGTGEQALPPAELGRAGERMRWWRVDPERELDEWIFECFIALDDPTTGRGWAMRALDTD